MRVLHDDPVVPPAMRGGNDPRGRLPRGAFVGRDVEMAHGLAALEDALAGRGLLLLVAGEPGIGKSRLADEIAAQAKDRGAQVVWGRCWEAGGAPAYWPWVQSLRGLIGDLDPEQLRRDLSSAAGDIAQLLPELRGTAGVEPYPSTQDPDAARFQLFDAATSFLKSRAAERPLMVVLDDLHVADTPSLLLLLFVARSLGDDRILIVATYRDTELTPGGALGSALVDLARAPAVRQMTLRGLAQAEVAQFITATAGFVASEDVARVVHDETEGNPLFMHEVTRLLLEEGRLSEIDDDVQPVVGLPRSVREVISRRLKPLSVIPHHVLTLASVFGREFDLDALSRLAERTLDEILDALEEPRAARVVIDVPGASSRLRFSHAVVRECLYGDIPRSRRRQLHHRAAQVLEELYKDELEPHLAELAHHFFEAVPAADVEKTIAYARRAGDMADSQLAYEEAIRLYRMTLRGLELSPRKDPQRRCDALLAMGDAQGRAGHEFGWKETFLQAAELARKLGRSDQLARAALGYGGRRVWVRAGDDPRLISLLRDGLEALGEDDSALRARLLARLAGALRDDPNPGERESLGREAVDMARRLGDPATLAYTLEGLWAALWRADNSHERAALAKELVAAGEAARDRERVVAGRQNRLLVFFELGDIPAVYRELRQIELVTQEARQPTLKWLPADARISLAFLEGRFADAEQLALEALRLRGGTNRSDALTHYTLHMFQLRREQGRLIEVQDLVRSSAAEFTWYPMLRCALACLHYEVGHEAQARAEFEQLSADDFSRIPFDNHWLLCMSLLSEITCSLEDLARAKTLYEQVLPYAELASLAAGGDSRTGSMHGPLGRLAAVLSRFDQAKLHFEKALQRNQRMGARPTAAHTQYEFAMALAERRGAGDRERAGGYLREALQTCDELGMPVLGAKVAGALTDLGFAGPIVEIEAPSVRAAATAAIPGAPTNLLADQALRLEGEYWSVVYEGRVLRLRDSKGMRILTRLLADPGRPHASLDLERLDASGDDATAQAVAAGDAGELLDDEARRAYRARIAELSEAIEDADRWGKADEAGAMRDEMDFITRELSRAVGLGGRARRAGSVAERARLNVTRAVKSALRRIAAGDAGLAAHLEATVHTGTVCVYTPDPRAAVAWRVSLPEVRFG